MGTAIEGVGLTIGLISLMLKLGWLALCGLATCSVPVMLVDLVTPFRWLFLAVWCGLILYIGAPIYERSPPKHKRHWHKRSMAILLDTTRRHH